jgi:hypothetical protein
VYRDREERRGEERRGEGRRGEERRGEEWRGEERSWQVDYLLSAWFVPVSACVCLCLPVSACVCLCLSVAWRTGASGKGEGWVGLLRVYVREVGAGCGGLWDGRCGGGGAGVGAGGVGVEFEVRVRVRE